MISPDYIAGLRAAEAACLQRKNAAIMERGKTETEAERTACTNDALEALECALAVRALIEKTAS